jgi:MoaA/NifB/PqqE/SkfB family radical SAM enzyme
MILSLVKRMLVEPDARILVKCLYLLAWRGGRSMAVFQRRAARGLRSPAVLFLSLTDRCNLSCRGCWVTPGQPPRELAPEALDAVIEEWTRENRSHFFGLLGGEPLLYPHLMETLARHNDCYFQILTNGMLLDDARAAAFRRLGNVTPLISIEGDPPTSDARRGAQDVWRRGMAAIEACRRHRLIFGVATSICKNNLADLASDAFIRDMIARGAHYLWYYIYRPVGPDPAPELALDAADILRLRRFLVEARGRHPILLVDAYWDADGRAICPAAEGISHHIGPGGDIEPCPPVQFSCENIRDGRSLNTLFQNSAFLEQFRRRAAAEGRGCILLADPAALGDVVTAANARDTSGRDSGRRELAAMCRRPCHDLPGQEIPEKQWLYRFAKKRWFWGFGTYG